MTPDNAMLTALTKQENPMTAKTPAEVPAVTLRRLCDTFAAFGDGAANAADIAALDTAIAALSAPQREGGKVQDAIEWLRSNASVSAGRLYYENERKARERLASLAQPGGADRAETPPDERESQYRTARPDRAAAQGRRHVRHAHGDRDAPLT